MRKDILLTVIFMAVIMVFTSCSDNNPVKLPSKLKAGKLYMPQAQKNPIQIKITGVNRIDTVEYSANVGGPGAAKKDLQVSFNVNSSLIEAYNSAHSTSYTLLPESNYKMSKKEIVLSAGTKHGPSLELIINYNPNPLVKGKKYLLPVRLKLESEGLGVFKNLNTVYFVVVSSIIPPPPGEGTETDPYKIDSLDDLKWLSRNSSAWDAAFIQTKDINATETKTLNNGKGFEPIGNEKIKFTGSYKGQGHTIRGLHINRPEASVIGFFGYVSSEGLIKNVHLTNVNIIGKVLTGGLAAINYGKIIGSDVSKGHVKAAGSNDDRSGGLVASNYGLIKNSFTNVKVSGVNDYMGGLVGYNAKDAIIKGSHATGDVIVGPGDPDGAGGLVGENVGKILHSYATGDVDATVGDDGGEDTGGLVGSGDGVIKYSHATGDVSGSGSTGGLVGNSRGLIFRCYATGDVTAKDGGSSGGLVGWAGGSSKVKESFATGNVVKKTDAGNVAALVGDTHGLVLNSYALGNVKSSGGNIGGVVGYLGGGTIKHSYSAGDVSATDDSADIGGLVGDQAGPNDGHGISESYWNVTTSGLTNLLGTGPASSSGEGLTTKQMKGASAKKYMKGFDFNNVWKIGPNGYPILRGININK